MKSDFRNDFNDHKERERLSSERQDRQVVNREEQRATDQERFRKWSNEVLVPELTKYRSIIMEDGKDHCNFGPHPNDKHTVIFNLRQHSMSFSLTASGELLVSFDNISGPRISTSRSWTFENLLQPQVEEQVDFFVRRVLGMPIDEIERLERQKNENAQVYFNAMTAGRRK